MNQPPLPSVFVHALVLVKPVNIPLAVRQQQASCEPWPWVSVAIRPISSLAVSLAKTLTPNPAPTLELKAFFFFPNQSLKLKTF